MAPAASSPSKWWHLFTSLVRGAFWTLATLFLGFFPVFIKIGVVTWTGRPMDTFEEMVRGGLVVGVVLALVGGVVIDHVFKRGSNINTFPEKLLFFVFPLFVISVSCVSYTILVLAEPTSLNVRHAATFYKGMLLACILYCLVTKFLHFHSYPKNIPSHG